MSCDLNDAKTPVILRAQRNALRMLDLRKIEGEDVPIDNLECSSFVWGVRRGDAWAVIMVNDASKQVVMDIVDYCVPPAEPADNDISDAHGAAPAEQAVKRIPIAHCIVVYVNKCTVIAGKEMDAIQTVCMERFSVEDVARCPLDLEWQAEYELLTDPDVIANVKSRFGVKGLAEIWTTDATHRWFNAPVGSIYKTTKRWKGLQPDVEYRVVKEPTS